MEQERKVITEQGIVDKIKSLEPQQIAEVMDFIELLAEKRRKESPLVRFLNEAVGPEVRLEELRKRLAKIPGSMAGVVREQRDERG
ncbi:MAG: hypothetical protein HY695_24525 [Deltaproteobacteria bacterium]|nr:hypothetical protein [Deltaproteobacteria bacterium]